MILIAVEKKESRGKKREREIRLPVWICAAFNAVQSYPSPKNPDISIQYPAILPMKYPTDIYRIK